MTKKPKKVQFDKPWLRKLKRDSALKAQRLGIDIVKVLAQQMNRLGLTPQDMADKMKISKKEFLKTTKIGYELDLLTIAKWEAILGFSLIVTPLRLAATKEVDGDSYKYFA